jgi:hypothetical protein
MPGFDGTGPSGTGPISGGGRGRCAPRGTFRDRLFRGTGFGQGRGFGRRRLSASDDIYPEGNDRDTTSLQGKAEALKRELEQVEDRINEIKRENK